MSLTTMEIIESVKTLTVAELVTLTKELQETFGVTANRAPAPIQIIDEPIVEAPTSFNVMLIAAGEKKISVIKTVREVTGLGLKEAKELVDTAPKSIKEGLSQADADALAAKFTAEGATVEIKACA